MKNYLKSLIKIICFIAIISYLLFLVVGICWSVFSLPLVAPELLCAKWWFVLVVPFFIYVLPLEGISLMLYYALVVLCISVSFALICKKKNGKRQIITVAYIFFALVAFIEIYYLVLTALHVSYIVPPFENLPLWEYTFAVTNASVHEELVTRVLLLGLPLFLIHGFTGKDVRLKKYIFGGNLGFGFSALLLLLFSSAVFAFAHVFIWDMYKVIPTFITGIALGYLFLRFGLHASIMLHFSLNYTGLVLGFFDYVIPRSALILNTVWFFAGIIYLLRKIREKI